MDPKNIGETNKPSNKKTVILVVILVILLVGAGAVAFWWRNDQANKQKAKNEATISQLQKDVADLKKQLTATPTPTSTPTPTVAPASSKQPSASTLENIKAAFVSKNTAALEGYMAPKVKVVYAATEFGGDKTPAEAVKAMDYVNSGAVAPWNFNLDAATLAKYQKGFYGQYFTPTTLVGKSSNGYVVAVNFDSNGKINGIFVAASDTLLV